VPLDLEASGVGETSPGSRHVPDTSGHGRSLERPSSVRRLCLLPPCFHSSSGAAGRTVGSLVVARDGDQAEPWFEAGQGTHRVTVTAILRFAGWIGVIGIVVLSLVPGSERPHTGMAGAWEHAIAYAMTGAAFALGYQDRKARVFLLVLLLMCAAILETAQIWIPGRSPYIGDALVSSFSAVAGVLGAALIGRLLLKDIRLAYPLGLPPFRFDQPFSPTVRLQTGG
jgi:VanZ family protein